jgi:hypothetical protein
MRMLSVRIKVRGLRVDLRIFEMIFIVPKTAKMQKSLLTLTNATKANPKFFWPNLSFNLV